MYSTYCRRCCLSHGSLSRGGQLDSDSLRTASASMLTMFAFCVSCFVHPLSVLLVHV